MPTLVSRAIEACRAAATLPEGALIPSRPDTKSLALSTLSCKGLHTGSDSVSGLRLATSA
jgi:hypothetical protein